MSAKLTITPNGPIRVEGEFQIVDGAGNAWDTGGKAAVFVCRCGKSGRQPFCDGTHKTCGFDAPASAPAT